MKITYQKILYAVFGLMVVVTVVYFSSGGGGGGTVAVAAPDEIVVGKELLDLFDQMKLITLDQNIFTNPVFNSLNDFGLTIAPQPIGRNNPFAPLGTSNSAGTTTTETITAD